jgi:hypothetical protein
MKPFVITRRPDRSIEGLATPMIHVECAICSYRFDVIGTVDNDD